MTHKKNLNFLISAGPTREFIDPVRFISNCSTGRVGYETAKAAAGKGHKVVLVSGPSALREAPGVKKIDVLTAAQMLRALKKNIKWADCLIMTAAVADFRPARTALKKIKKHHSKLTLSLVKNPDILKSLRPYKKNKIYIGFALETHSLINNAAEKLKNKGLDLVVANRIEPDAACFGKNRNTYHAIDKLFNCMVLTNISKSGLARALLDKAANMCYSLRCGKSG